MTYLYQEEQGRLFNIWMAAVMLPASPLLASSYMVYISFSISAKLKHKTMVA